MSYSEEFDALCSLFRDAWKNRTPVAWPNKEFNLPNPPAPWCRFTILHGASSRVTIGSPGGNRAVYPGRVIVQIFVPKTQGESQAREFADVAADAFRDASLPRCRFFLPYAERVEHSMADTYWQVNVNCPFQRDEYHG